VDEEAGVIRLAALRVCYGDVTAVDGLDLGVDDGDWVCLIGPNGAGKSSVLRALAGLVGHEGRAAVNGRALHALRPRAVARLVAYVPQKPVLPADMTVADYVLLGRTAHIPYFGTERRRDREVCTDLLDRLELETMAARPVGTLSGGESQRIVLARALAQEAPVLLLDEPTSALDLGHQLQALELVDEVRRERSLTVLSAMHDLTLAGQFADRLALLQLGRLVVCGEPADVLQPATIAEHYGAAVEVLTAPDGSLVVVPVRAASAAAVADPSL
jgi:iron complex transport system ATP-binding protein